MADLHPSLARFAGLLGSWSGEGAGEYPNIDPFRYLEEVTFGHDGRALLTYAQRTSHPESGAAMHAEVGFLRPAPDDGVELVLAHSMGIAEVAEGTFDGAVLEVRSTLMPTATAKVVRSLRRRFELADDTLRYELYMAYDVVPETLHLTATLHRTDGHSPEVRRTPQPG